MNNRRVKKLSWKESSKKLSHANSELTNLIAKCPITDAHSFIEMDYNFGERIIKNGDFLLPEEKKFDKKDFPELDYDWPINPFGVVIGGYAESFWENSCQIIPRGNLTPGRTCGLRDMLWRDEEYIFHRVWSLTAGSRLIFQLANISEKRSMKRFLKYFNINAVIPNHYDEHWHLLSKLARSLRFHNQWQTKILFFSKKWVEDIRNSEDKNFIRLRDYLLNIRWNATEFARNQNIIDFIWDEFVSLASEIKEFRGKAHIFDVAKHIILIACGGEFGYAPAGVNNTVAPIKEFVKSFKEIYHTDHCPTFMYPAKLAQSDDAVYYSLQHAKHLTSSPRQLTRRNNKEDLIDIKKLLELFFEKLISSSELQVENSIIEQIPDNIMLNYYRPEVDYRKLCQHPKEILSQDKRFLYNGFEFKNSDFCYTNLFFKGCIKISRKHKNN